MLLRSSLDELLLVDGWDWGGMGWGLELFMGVDRGGGCLFFGVFILFILYNSWILSICYKRMVVYLFLIVNMYCVIMY